MIKGRGKTPALLFLPPTLSSPDLFRRTIFPDDEMLDVLHDGLPEQVRQRHVGGMQQ
jgi:hypothetical protein